MIGLFGVNQESCRLAVGKEILREVDLEAVRIEPCVARCAIQFVLDEYVKLVLPIHAGICPLDNLDGSGSHPSRTQGP